jgi:hypothetical protein
MAEPVIINASTAPTGMSMESPPVFGSTPSLGIVSRITPSLGELVSRELVAAPVVVFAAPVLAPVVDPVVAPVVVSVVLVVLVVVPVVVPVVLVVVPVVLPGVVPVVAVVLVPVVPVVLVPVVVLPSPMLSPTT